MIDVGLGGQRNPLAIFRLRRLLRGYDIAHSHNTTEQFFLALAGWGGGTPLVTTEHSTWNRRRAWPLFRLVDRWIYRRYARIICISDKTREALSNYLGCERGMVVVPNGVDCGAVAAAVPAMTLRRDLPVGAVALCMAASFRAAKDQDTLIRALRLLPERYHLFLAGDGERGTVLRELAAELGVERRTHFLGIRNDVPAVLGAMDIVVHSSHWEGFGLSVVEGMAAGKPVIASDVPGVAEVVRGAGVLVPPADYRAFARAVEELSNDSSRCAEVAARCRARAAEYDIHRTAERYLDEYAALFRDRV